MYDFRPPPHPLVSLGVLQRVGSCEAGNLSHGKDVTPWLPLPFRVLQPLPLEGVERSLPGFIEALTWEARATGSQLQSWDWNPDVLLCIRGSSQLCAVCLGPRAPGQWREAGRFESGTWWWLF